MNDPFSPILLQKDLHCASLKSLLQALPAPLPGMQTAGTDDWELTLRQGRLLLSHVHKSHLHNIHVDFDVQARRLNKARLAHELLVKAVGGMAPPQKIIVDATAGLAGDSALLAAAGHSVTMVEQSPVVAALLQNALTRQPEWQQQLALRAGNASQLLARGELGQPELVYLDPMFPATGKAALARKGLQALKELLPPQDDGAGLLHAALQAATYRVVVKRPLRADPLPGKAPGFSYRGKLIRYDCYPCEPAIPTNSS